MFSLCSFLEIDWLIKINFEHGSTPWICFSALLKLDMLVSIVTAYYDTNNSKEEFQLGECIKDEDVCVHCDIVQ